MTITAQRNALMGATVLLIVASVGVVLWSLGSLESVATSSVQGNRERSTPQVPSTTTVANVNNKVAARSLRRPLYDPPPSPPRAPVKKPDPRPRTPPPPPSLNITLVGTILDAEQNFAILADADGNFDVKAVGESLELEPKGMVLKSVEAESVTVDHQGRVSTLKLDRSKKARAGGNRGNNRRRNRP